jgi:prephenate dehydrogenase
MGGSLGRGLVQASACKQVRALVRRGFAAKEAVSCGAADVAGTDPRTLLEGADLVVLATPVLTIEEQIATLPEFIKDTAVVTDMGSVKRGVVHAMEQLPSHMHPVGGHPMCGKETRGIQASDPDLFRNKIWVITPLKRSTPDALALVRELAISVGARPVIMNAEDHDNIAACISHLPYLLASTLVGVAEEASYKQPGVWDLASSGFRDTSRVAAGDLKMMMDILVSNRDNLATFLRMARTRIDRFLHLLEDGDSAALKDELTPIGKRRSAMFQDNGKPVP